MSRPTARRSDDLRAPPAAPAGQRLQKVLAAAGLGSRRQCEELIREGRVEVDRQVVTELGVRVDPDTQEIRVDGQPLRPRKKVYYAVNKPPGVVTTQRDPAGRPRVIDLVPTQQRVFAVGRLDRSSEGLILVTNDGDFANRITHPRYGVEKTYLVRVAGVPQPQQLARLKRGVHLAEGVARVQRIAVKRRHGQSTDLVIVLNEGRNREIRRILAKVGHKVLALKRVAIGPIKLADLPSGGWRRLTPQEVAKLLALAQPRQKPTRAPFARKARPKPSPWPTASTAQEPSRKSPPAAPQAQAQPTLFDQPLSLEDLLRDDLDEAGLDDTAASGSDASLLAIDELAGHAPGRAGRVIGADAFAAPPRPASGHAAQEAAPEAMQRGRKASRPQSGQRGGKTSSGSKHRPRRGKQALRPHDKPHQAKPSAASRRQRKGRRRKG
jgi:23S rRNA pseudouridine2605 synthase